MSGFIVAGLIVLVIVIRMRKTLAAMAVSALGGLCTLGVINLTGILTGVMLPFNVFSLLVSCVLGAPGVISLLLLQLVW
ncbi:MAG: pro-sigmaK processing inhibitor BofA family protein [Angelakisella sp.]|nr:pro-sigmaK processing inhibitor BofA family protein [Angelakisella sp.]